MLFIFAFVLNYACIRTYLLRAVAIYFTNCLQINLFSQPCPAMLCDTLAAVAARAYKYLYVPVASERTAKIDYKSRTKIQIDL